MRQRQRGLRPDGRSGDRRPQRTITGTGYNDTFIAEDGTYTYNGSGGWNTHSDYDTWSNTGGMDVVDYRNATSGVTVDLRLSTAQDTGLVPHGC